VHILFYDLFWTQKNIAWVCGDFAGRIYPFPQLFIDKIVYFPLCSFGDKCPITFDFFGGIRIGCIADPQFAAKETLRTLSSWAKKWLDIYAKPEGTISSTGVSIFILPHVLLSCHHMRGSDQVTIFDWFIFLDRDWFLPTFGMSASNFFPNCKFSVFVGFSSLLLLFSLFLLASLYDTLHSREHLVLSTFPGFPVDLRNCVYVPWV